MKTCYSCNTGIYSGIEPVTLSDSNRDPNQGYVQHAYDIVVDTSQIGQGRNQRIKLILRRHQETANRLGSPVIIGEWGAFGWSADQAIVASAHAIQRKFEKLLCGDTYWDYGRKIAEQACFHTLKRSIPTRVAGELFEYRCDPTTGKFSCRWKESADIDSPSIMYLTERSIAGRKITLMVMRRDTMCLRCSLAVRMSKSQSRRWGNRSNGNSLLASDPSAFEFADAQRVAGVTNESGAR